jgi:hypothetical protein
MGLVLSHGYPEHVTGLPRRGEGRNHDLLLFGQHQGAPIVVSIEAKVDETFGDRVGKYWSKMIKNEKSGAPRRIETLLSCVFGTSAKPDETPWKNLRYQLLTALVGTAIEASLAGARVGVFIVHELHTAKAKEHKLVRNTVAVADFLRACGLKANDDDQPGQLYGPISVKSAVDSTSSVDIFVGRAVYRWEVRQGGA